ncbi:hypothetical protein CCR75_008983 [Bremia lactucae]|uniref:RxLR effector protein n=1 Tax=Bremia lactucae TaxID=4779 RepID=A0A976IHH2_BRELC|nr:hypothetical protein CCR75_008983 [Bremia lactucae]
MLLSRAISVVALLACICCGVHTQDSKADLGTLRTTDSAIITSQRRLRTSVDLVDNEERFRWPFQQFFKDRWHRKQIKTYFRDQKDNVPEGLVEQLIARHGLKNVEKVLSEVKFPLAVQISIRKILVNYKGKQAFTRPHLTPADTL